MVPKSSGSQRRGTKPNQDSSREPHGNTNIVDSLGEALECRSIGLLRRKVKEIAETSYEDTKSNSSGPSGSYLPLKEDLVQILDAQTLERAKYYTNRLLKSLTGNKTNGINDINLHRWKQYDDILTDSLWTFDKRDTSGSHLGWYWGNFVPQIPHQLILRYTKRGDWVLDPFAGSGTTLIECVRLGRNGIGVELSEETKSRAASLIASESNDFGVRTVLKDGDSTRMDFSKLCKKSGASRVQLTIMHPPYFDIIKFSDKSRDLSNSASVEKFLVEFGRVVKRTYPVLQDGRYLALIAGDKYQNGEWIPLGFYMMQEVLKNGYKLIGIVTKNFEDTRAKRDQKELWRYRALAGGFYVFKHEYIFIFKKQS